MGKRLSDFLSHAGRIGKWWESRHRQNFHLWWSKEEVQGVGLASDGVSTMAELALPDIAEVFQHGAICLADMPRVEIWAILKLHTFRS